MDVSFDSENSFAAHSNNITINQANENEFCDLSVSFNLDNSLLSREPIAKISHVESNNSTMSPTSGKKLCDLNVSFDLDDSMLSCEPIPNISKVACSIKPKSVNCHTERLVAHYLKFNQSYNGLENMAHIMNLMDNVSIQVPESRYKIMKQINPQFKIEFHIFCSKCKNYTATSTQEILCSSCSNKLKTAEAKYFVYIPIEQQLRKDELHNLRLMLDYCLFHSSSITYLPVSHWSFIWNFVATMELERFERIVFHLRAQFQRRKNGQKSHAVTMNRSELRRQTSTSRNG